MPVGRAILPDPVSVSMLALSQEARWTLTFP